MANKWKNGETEIATVVPLGLVEMGVCTRNQGATGQSYNLHPPYFTTDAHLRHFF